MEYWSESSLYLIVAANATLECSRVVQNCHTQPLWNGKFLGNLQLDRRSQGAQCALQCNRCSAVSQVLRPLQRSVDESIHAGAQLQIDFSLNLQGALFLWENALEGEHEHSCYRPERGASHSLSVGDYKKKILLFLFFFFCHNVRCCFWTLHASFFISLAVLRIRINLDQEHSHIENLVKYEYQSSFFFLGDVTLIEKLKKWSSWKFYLCWKD